MVHLTAITRTGRHLVALLLAALLTSILTPGAQAAPAAPASTGGPSAAACVWNNTFTATVPHNGGFAYATNNVGATTYFIAGCGGVIIRATNLNFGTRVWAVRCNDNTSLGSVDVTLLNTNYTVTNQFLAQGTCVRLEMQKLPWQPSGPGTHYQLWGSVAT